MVQKFAVNIGLKIEELLVGPIRIADYLIRLKDVLEIQFISEGLKICNRSFKGKNGFEKSFSFGNGAIERLETKKSSENVVQWACRS